ncbi:head GIN domain-containing protein [Roseivirga sp.]|uniref:head GIN domain-containing protein n=1 Tax=Roseivirga sp. TaxID=1964215 RepID=UPI003B51C2AC
MRKYSIILILSLFVSLAWSQTKETRDVGNFDFIAMNISGKVYLTQGDKNEVIVEADRDDLEKIRTEVRGGRLSISTRNERRWFSWGDGLDGRVNIYITVKELRGVSVSGSGDVISQNVIKGDDFETSISGSGDIEIELDVRRVESKITGSGNIELKGSAQRARLGISGSGKYFAEELKVDDYQVSISGSGRASINTNGELDVRISGSGSVYYSGDPTGVNTNVSGSGRVRRNN